jgi:hypothetical protein
MTVALFKKFTHLFYTASFLCNAYTHIPTYMYIDLYIFIFVTEYSQNFNIFVRERVGYFLRLKYKHWFIRSSCLCLCVYPLIAARQRLGKYFPATRKIYAIIEKIWDESFSVRCVSYEMKKNAISSFQNNLLFRHRRLCRKVPGLLLF